MPAHYEINYIFIYNRSNKISKKLSFYLCYFTRDIKYNSLYTRLSWFQSYYTILEALPEPMQNEPYQMKFLRGSLKKFAKLFHKINTLKHSEEECLFLFAISFCLYLRITQYTCFWCCAYFFIIFVVASHGTWTWILLLRNTV